MQVDVFQPPPLLADFVDTVWVFDGRGISHSLERIVPNGTMQLLVNLEEDELRWHEGTSFNSARRVSGAALAGAWSKPFLIDTEQQRRITGVSFKPGGAAAFFAMSSDLFRNDHIDLVDIVNVRGLREQLRSARDADAISDCWFKFLLANLVPERVPQWIGFACRSLEGQQAVESVATDCALDPRRFRHAFSAAVGISPKQFSRIRRLQRVAEQVALLPVDHSPDWSSLAAHHGYFDQAHLIRDFRLIAGVPPTAYQPRSAQDWNHCPELS